MEWHQQVSGAVVGNVHEGSVPALGFKMFEIRDISRIESVAS